MKYDIIIVGGGTSACVVAARLAEKRPDLQIALIEEGPDTKGDDSVTRPLQGMFSALTGSPNAKTYVSQPDPALEGREVPVACGNCLGGGSSVNFMIYNQAAASDWDDWDQPGWSYDEMRRFIDKPVKYLAGDGTRQGREGPMEITHGGHECPLWMNQLFDALPQTRQMSKLDDMADKEHGDGYGLHAKWIDSHGVRCSTAIKYLLERGHRDEGSHIAIIPGSVEHVTFEDDCVSGVRMYDGASLYATEVILSAGTFGPGPILERSGIGHGLACVDLEVGKTVKDHQVGLCVADQKYSERCDHDVAHLKKILVPYLIDPTAETLDDYLNLVPEVLQRETRQWLIDGTGQVATNGINLGFKWHPNEEEMCLLGDAFASHWRSIGEGKPDKPLVTCALACQYIGDRSTLKPNDKYMTFGYWTNYPASEGSLHATSDGFEFKAGLLHESADLAVLVHMYKWTRDVARKMPVFRAEDPRDHPGFAAESSAALSIPPDQTLIYSESDDASIEEWIKKNVATCWHSMGTCPMRQRQRGGVVDPRLNVYGVKGLRIADLSVVPTYMGTNTTSVALAIGEKCADLILEDLAVL